MIFKLLNKVKVVVVFVLGEYKQGIVIKFLDGEVDVWNYFVIGIQFDIGDLFWYIDDEVFGRYQNLLLRFFSVRVRNFVFMKLYGRIKIQLGF